jgi:hypothetical protein
MKRLSILAVVLFSRMTFAEPTAASGSSPEVKSAEAKSAVALVSHDLIQPFAAQQEKQGRFTRGRLPAAAHRVRILDEKQRTDTAGVAFLRFAVDSRYGFFEPTHDDESRWNRDTITGCVYLERNQVFVKKGDGYRPAAFLLGKNVKAAAESTCTPAADQVAHAN